ncbi:efflux RND transporter periplasmic adaptor subunit [Brevibacillus sp. SYP-B805]|uniref:efflux RND transporter periplasmic adaptor subunit n=1 Tax=Brevibacillus sp. SYP-B805 TaxID=1578199 RepID=UPI0013EDF2F0|nr:efflux RND transporter periplasmic adaptor subunit [Brevibacillus sp. SYP-B805]NGQ96805.1 efflux RND transporter periplasmic adaptor subunit [Brevibacillus sp. SYP-B805]
MNKGIKSLGLLLSLFVVLTGCAPQQAAEQPAEKGPVPVQVDVVKTGSVTSEAGISGRLAPNKEVAVSPKVSGKITALNVVLGQFVKQGQTLFQLDRMDLVNAVQQAEAQYNLARANLNQSTNSTVQGVAQAETGLQQARQALADAERNEQRMKQLFDQGAVSSQQYEQAKTALLNAQTAYANAQQALATAKQRSGEVVSQASVEQARVALENAREQLANATIVAPISGYVAQVNGAVGEMASPQTPVVTIVNTDPLLVKANLAETEITGVKVGTKVKVMIDSLQKEVEGTITAVSPVMDQTLKAYPIEIALPNHSGELKADMVASVKLNAAGQGKASTLVIPRKAVFDENGKRYVFKLEGDKAKKVEVVTGEESSDLAEVKSGLAQGDKIVVRGQTLLADGDTVKVQAVGD